MTTQRYLPGDLIRWRYDNGHRTVGMVVVAGIDSLMSDDPWAFVWVLWAQPPAFEMVYTGNTVPL